MRLFLFLCKIALYFGFFFRKFKWTMAFVVMNSAFWSTHGDFRWFVLELFLLNSGVGYVFPPNLNVSWSGWRNTLDTWQFEKRQMNSFYKKLLFHLVCLPAKIHLFLFPFWYPLQRLACGNCVYFLLILRWSCCMDLVYPIVSHWFMEFSAPSEVASRMCTIAWIQPQNIGIQSPPIRMNPTFCRNSSYRQENVWMPQIAIHLFFLPSDKCIPTVNMIRSPPHSFYWTLSTNNLFTFYLKCCPNHIHLKDPFFYCFIIPFHAIDLICHSDTLNETRKASFDTFLFSLLN